MKNVPVNDLNRSSLHIASKATSFVEVALAFIVAAGLVYVAVFYSQVGYLPQSFLYDVTDPLMDLYHTAHWSYQKGAYSVWNSIYPPISFVFIRAFSIKECYRTDAFMGRECDHLLLYVFFFIFTLNAVIIYLSFRRENHQNSLPRAFALAFGMPMLFGLDRGNLIIPCFTFFALSFGQLLGSRITKIGMLAIAINFKPYLLLTALPSIAQKKIDWLMRLVVFGLAVYLATYFIQGGGSPLELYQNMQTWGAETGGNFWEKIYYSTSFSPLLRFASSDFPLLQYIESDLLDKLIFLFSTLKWVGIIGVILVYSLISVGRTVEDNRRIVAMTITLLLVISESSGGYALIFTLYLVFFESWKGWVRGWMIVAAYLLCIPLDYTLMTAFQGAAEAFWSGRQVYSEFGVSVGQFARPLLVLSILYCLIFLNLQEAIRSLLARYSTVNP